MDIKKFRKRKFALSEYDSFSPGPVKLTAYADKADAADYLATSGKYQTWHYEGDVMRRHEVENSRLKCLANASDALERLNFKDHDIAGTPIEENYTKALKTVLKQACVLIAAEFHLDSELENDDVFADSKLASYAATKSGLVKALRILEPVLHEDGGA